MKKKIAILGYGMRGGIYAGYAAKYPEEFNRNLYYDASYGQDVRDYIEGA